MAKQEEQEGWDSWKFQDVFIDFSFFGEEFMAQSALDDHTQQQDQELMSDLMRDDIIRSLDDGLTEQLEPIILPSPSHVEQQVNERFLRSDFVEANHVEAVVTTNVAPSKMKLNPESRTKRRNGWKNSPEGIKHCAIAKERQKIKNRESAAAKSHSKKQKYVKDLELQYAGLCNENAIRKRVLKFLEISMEVGTLPRKLARTSSGPIPSY